MESSQEDTIQQVTEWIKNTRLKVRTGLISYEEYLRRGQVVLRWMVREVPSISAEIQNKIAAKLFRGIRAN